MKKKIIILILVILLGASITLSQAAKYRGMEMTQGFVTPKYAERSQEKTPVNSPKTGGPPYFINYVEDENTKGKKLIALTYDLCSGDFDRRIPEFLIANSIPATFFITERWVENGHSEDLNYLLNAKDSSGKKLFEIGGHSKTHPSQKGTTIFWGGTGTEQDMISEWRDSVEFLRNKGADIKVCRLPVAQPWTMEQTESDKAGISMLDLLKSTAQYCPEFIQYDIWANEGPSVSESNYVQSVVNNLKPDKASIVLMHANQPKWTDGANLPALASKLKEQNYQFLTVSDLLNTYAPVSAGQQPQAPAQKAPEKATELPSAPKTLGSLQLYATYLIPGTFSAVIEQTLEPYIKVQNWMKAVVIAEGLCGKAVTPECLAEKTRGDADFDYYFKLNRQYYFSDSSANAREAWNKYCENPDEEFFSDFAEFFDSCMEAGDACSCKMDNANNKALNANSISSRNISENRYDISLTGYDRIFSLFTKNYKAEFPSEIKNGFEFDYQEPNERTDKLPTIFMNKNKAEGRITFSENALLPDCNAEAMMIKVCAVSKNVKIKTENPITGKFEETPLTFRFAFMPPNTPPPDVKGVSVDDLKRASGTIVISWYKSPARNVFSYNLYQQADDFAGEDSEEVRKTIVPLPIDASAAKTVKSINLKPMCEKTGNKLCDFGFDAQIEDSEGKVSTEKIMPQPGLLIYENDTNRYYYILGIKDNAKMDFGVAAVNKKGLESESFVETPEAQSIDDIPPGFVTITHVPNPAIAAENYLGFARPDMNIDNSPLGPSVQLEYDILESCQGGAFGFEFSTASTGVIQPALNEDCILKVIAKKPVPTPDLFTPLFASPEDADIINYLLQ